MRCIHGYASIDVTEMFKQTTFYLNWNMRKKTESFALAREFWFWFLALNALR